MGRQKQRKPRRPRRGADMPRGDELLVPSGVDLPALAAAYRCSDCHHGPAVYRRDAFTGREVVDIPHSDSCPVPRGLVDALPDIRRAFAAAGA